MIRPYLAAAIVLCLSAAASAQGVNNPMYSAWVKFDAGATSRYAGVSRVLGIETTIETTMKLIEKSSDKVVIEVSRKVTSGNDTVDETPRREEIKATIAADMAFGDAGEEETTAGGATYKCRVFQQQRKQGQPPNEIALYARYWMNDQIPGGIVRVDSRTDGQIAISTTIELKSHKP